MASAADVTGAVDQPHKMAAARRQTASRALGNIMQIHELLLARLDVGRFPPFGNPSFGGVYREALGILACCALDTPRNPQANAQSEPPSRSG